MKWYYFFFEPLRRWDPDLDFAVGVGSLIILLSPRVSLDANLEALFRWIYPRDPTLSSNDTAVRVDFCAAATSPLSVDALAVLT